MKVDPPPGAKCKDKFLVQSSLIEASMEHLNLAEIVCLLSSALATVESLADFIVGPVATVVKHREGGQGEDLGAEDSVCLH